MKFQNRSFTILGAGRSGIAIARLLHESSAKVFLSDENEKENLKYLDEELLKAEGIDYEISGHSDKVFENEIFIKSPGISPEADVIVKAIKAGKKIYSEIEAAFWFCKSPVIAITGTNGKTTTTVLTGEIFKNAGFDVKVCGNVGVAFSDVVGAANENSVVVLEVSSFQLNDIEEFKPGVSVLMNITPDHLEWHGNFENYLDAKLNVTRNQNERDLTVINYDDENLRDAVKNNKVRKSYFSIRHNLEQSGIHTGSYINNGKIIYFDRENGKEEIMDINEINIRGNHNLYNSLASIISARAFGIKKEIIRESLMKFPGVEHRIEFVKDIGGISFYNDSKATNVDSLIVALEAFDGGIILILGGREKRNDYSVIDNLVRKKVKRIVAIGESKDKIADHFRGNADVIKADTMEEAVQKAFESGNKGDVVLLSPACKSFDMFENFEQRGMEFKRVVNELKH